MREKREERREKREERRERREEREDPRRRELLQVSLPTSHPLIRQEESEKREERREKREERREKIEGGGRRRELSLREMERTTEKVSMEVLLFSFYLPHWHSYLYIDIAIYIAICIAIYSYRYMAISPPLTNYELSWWLGASQ